MQPPPHITTLDLMRLGLGMPGLTPTGGAWLAQAAAVCLEHRAHSVGVALRLDGIQTRRVRLTWSQVDEQQRRTHADLQEATEFGACGVAIILTEEVTGKVVLERSRKGPGFDYWLGDPDSDNALLFNGMARLEVSGILDGNAARIAKRVRDKKAQMGPSDHWAPGYVAVVEFGEPAAIVDEK